MAGANKAHRPDAGPGSGVNLVECRAGDINYMPRGIRGRVLKPRAVWEGSPGKAAAANRTREIRPSGMRGGLAETWIMVELGTHCTTERVHVGNSSPKAARAVFLPGERGMCLQG